MLVDVDELARTDELGGHIHRPATNAAMELSIASGSRKLTKAATSIFWPVMRKFQSRRFTDPNVPRCIE